MTVAELRRALDNYDDNSLIYVYDELSGIYDDLDTSGIVLGEDGNICLVG